MRWLPLLIAVPLLTACVSQATQRTIPVSQYREAAAHMTAMNQCSAFGFASPILMREGIRYAPPNILGSGYSPAVLNSAINEAVALTGFSEETVQRFNEGDFTEQEQAQVKQLQGMCSGYEKAVVRERQRRQSIARSNAQHQQQAINNMAATLGQMGQSMWQAGNNAQQATQPPAPSSQPNFGLPNNSWNHSLINTPGGLQQRHCTQTSSNTQYCF